MATTLDYRVRIRDASTTLNPNGTTDDLVITSQRGGTNPYLSAPVAGDGQEIDPLAGTTRAGQYTVQLLDVITSGTTRLFTSKLFDSDGRQVMLSRRVYLEYRENAGTWTALLTGFLLGYRLTDALTFECTIGDTRRVEQNLTVFDGLSSSFTKRGCLFGGPIVGGWGPIVDRGGWTLKVHSLFVDPTGANNMVQFDFTSGFRGYNDPLTTRYQDVIADGVTSDLAAKFYNAGEHYGQGGYSGLIAHVVKTDGTVIGACTPANITSPPAFFPCTANTRAPGARFFHVFWPIGTTMPSVGETFKVYCYSRYASAESPVYFDLHPVDIVTALWTDAGIAYDASVAAATKATLGDTLRVAMRVTQSEKMLSWLEANILGPFGLVARVGSDGEMELIPARYRPAAVPSVTVNTADLQDAETVIFENDESTVVSSVRFKTQVFTAFDAKGEAQGTRPPDGVVVGQRETVLTSGDVATYGTKEVAYEFSGMIHDAASFADGTESLAVATARDIFDRWGRGAPSGELRLLRGSDAGAQVGDEIYLQPAHLPNANKRYGDDNSVGARIVQVVRRTEAPEGPSLKVIDAGSALQPASPAAVITIAASANSARNVAAFTITNAAAINTAAVLRVAVEYATGASSPAGGTSILHYAAAACPTVATDLPAVASGTKVWARARTEQVGRRPSAWTSWVSVTLTAVVVPSGLTIGTIRQNAATLAWTNANATDYTDVFVYEGATPPADWTPHLVVSCDPGTTSATVRTLNGPTVTYQVAIAHRDPSNGTRGAMVTDSFATTSAADTLEEPIGCAIVPSTRDASLPSGVILALYPANVAYDFVIERAPNVSGAPGTYAELATVSGDTEIFIDWMPIDGTVYWYRVMHRLGGYADSDYAVEDLPVFGAAGGVPSRLVRPPAPRNPDRCAIRNVTREDIGPNLRYSFTLGPDVAEVWWAYKTITAPETDADWNDPVSGVSALLDTLPAGVLSVTAPLPLDGEVLLLEISPRYADLWAGPLRRWAIPCTAQVPVVALDDIETSTTGTQWVKFIERGIPITSVDVQTQIGTNPISAFGVPTRGPGDASAVKGGTLGAGEYEHDITLDAMKFSWIVFRYTLANGNVLVLPPFGFDRDRNPNILRAVVAGTVLDLLCDSDTKSIKVQRVA